MTRVNIKAILADQDLRRELMVPTIQAVQAREGIDTTRDQAERAYYVVTEADKAAFFDLERFRGGKRSEPDRREEMFVRGLFGNGERVRFEVARRDFSAIDGTPLAYRRLAHVAHIFRSAPSLEPSFADVRQGLSTADDRRFVRFWWEVREDQIGWNNDWVTFAKGGNFSRFFQSFELVVLWRDQGKEIKEYNESLYGKGGWSRQVRSEDRYGLAGLTWPRRTQRGFNIRRMPEDCIFADKGPAVLPHSSDSTFFVLGVLGSITAEYILQGLMSFGSWEVGIIKRLPIPDAPKGLRGRIAEGAISIHDAKAAWCHGDELSANFFRPWALRDEVSNDSLPHRFDSLIELESSEEARIQQLYSELNDEVYKLYGIPETTRAIIEETLGERPPEVLWPQMEGKSTEQKRMEHVWRLLSYAVKRVVDADEDGIVPFMAVGGETALADRVSAELAVLFPDQDINRVEVDINNELRRKVKGYRAVQSIREWLEDVFFDYHVSLYRKRPILWHIASSQGRGACAVGALCHYHKFDRDRLAKLRGSYLRDAISLFRREAGLADQEGRTEDRQEWQTKLEEAQSLDQRLQWVQEGQNGHPAPGDCRIRAPWKSEDELPSGWQPDIDDGVAVNILPLQTAGVLRIAQVV